MKWPTAIDLFSGPGGLTLGLKQAHFRVLGAVELDPLAAKTYRMNHPTVHLWEEDIRDLSVSRIKRELGLRKEELGLLAGCPPCEGFSRIRTLNGNRRIRDSRNDLLFEFLRFVRELNPRTVMLENVPGLAKDQRFSRFCAELAVAGYHYEYRLLDVQHYGVPQRRRRLVLLGSRDASVTFPPESSERKTVRSVIGNLAPAGRSGDPLHDVPESRSKEVMARIRAIPKDGGSRNDLPRRKQLGCHRRCDGFKDIYGRMRWDDVAPTITGGCVNPSKGRFLHPALSRAITLREAALLQGFPPAYEFPLSKGKFAVASMIGDALPPEFARLHARALRKFA